MKKIQTALAAGLVFLGVATPVFAEMNPQQLTEVTKIALDDFLKNNIHKDHMYGFKTWKSGDDAKVKIYVKHDGMEMSFDYHCMEDTGKLVCHAL